MLTHDEHLLVDHVRGTWAHSHAKATLAVLSLMLLQQRPRWAGELQEGLRDISAGVFDVDVQTLHRMLRRLDRLALVRCCELESTGPGAARKVFEATEVGVAAVKAHLQHTLAYLSSETFASAYRRVLAEPAPVCLCCARSKTAGGAQ